MSWINQTEIDRIDAEIKSVHPRADTTVEQHPTDDSLWRLKLTLRDPNTGNMVRREAEAGTNGAEMLADARDEMSGRARKTKRAISRENAPT